MPGVGSSGFGSVPYGLGLSLAVPPGGTILRDPSTGVTTGSRRIDPIKRDFVIDSFGRTSGMPDVQQLVLLAVSTEKGSSAVRDLGHELRSIARISPNFRRRVRRTLEGAVQHLVDLKLIEIVDVVIALAPITSPGRASVSLKWRDLTVDARFGAQSTEVL